VVVVESDDIEEKPQFVERIAAKMQTETNLFLDVFYAQNPMIMGSKGLLYASETNLMEMKTMLQAAGRSSGSSLKRRTWFRFLSRSTRRSAPRRARPTPTRIP